MSLPVVTWLPPSRRPRRGPHTEVVNADMGELRTSRYFADRPNARRGCLQALVDLDVSAIGKFNARQFQSNALGVWAPARATSR